MKTYTIKNLDDLYEAVDHLDFFQSGDELRFVGKLSQTISKAFNAYHKSIGGRAKARLGAGAAIGALAFGPVGWLISGSASAGLFAANRQLKEMKNSYRALPCAAEVEDLALAGFELLGNNGEQIILVKK